ncbi:MAG TPA: ABC transporter permease [Terracidiphilus sp.]|nr:ABC transporter permease [Terracidiphilus sp.]
MKYGEAFKVALQSLWANKMRSILTLLGVVIGVASVIMVVTLTNGARRFVTTKINTYGANVITISKMPQTFLTLEEYLKFQKRRNIDLEDYKAVKAGCRICMSVGASRSVTGSVVYGTHSTTDSQVRGWTWTMPSMSNLEVAEGRTFTELEESHDAHVTVIGADIASNMLAPGDPLGKEIHVDGIPYTVIGVAKPLGTMFGQSMDNWVAVPLPAFLSRYGAHSSLTIYAEAPAGGAVLEETMDELRVIMRIQRHLAPGKDDTFTIETSDTFQNILGKILGYFGAVVAAIASIALVVGGIVIMNIMLVSVTERTREIGVRKALGARRRDILLQFLIESSILAAIGGLFGIIAGIGIAKIITLVISFPSSVQLWSVLLGLFVATSVGLFFGVYPAARAAKLDPIVALRAEL